MIAIAQLGTVPAPSGERLFFGIAVATAVALLSPDMATATAVFSFGMAGSWAVLAVHDRERVLHGSRFTAEVVALGAFTLAFYGVKAAFHLQLVEGDLPRLSAAVAGGLAWYVVRAFMRALVGLERQDLSVRYLWLLALEDWAVILSLFTTGALFGFAWPSMGAWAVPVALLPYGFSHLAFVRYADTRRTYGQTIRALAQIPEVAGLAPVGHADRTASLALAMAQELGMHPHDVTDLEYAALMHDIGRITLNEPAILRAGYTDEDIARWGSQIIAEAPYLSRVAEFVKDQHRPYRQSGQHRDSSLSLASMVIKVASRFDQYAHEREWAAIDAIEALYRTSAYDHDPEVIVSLRRVLEHRGLLRSP
jgi:HD superfamily phosphodiesterase